MYDERLEQKGKPLTEAGTGKIPSVAPCYLHCGFFVMVGELFNHHFEDRVYAEIRKAELEAAGWDNVSVIKSYMEKQYDKK